MAPSTSRSNPAALPRRGLLERLGGWLAWLGFGALGATGALWAAAAARFLMPNAVVETPRRLKVGFPAEYPPGRVETKYRETHGIWIVHGRHAGRRAIYALSAVCTHLGCMTVWREAERRFRCPCHGSDFRDDGVHLAGPAPRPLPRCAIRVAEDGQLEVDRGRLFREELGQWDDPRSYVET
jgi:cytochrome b6-f complex iron-sulfur subunit